MDVKKWDNKKEQVTGNDAKSKEVNLYIETVRTKIMGIYRKLEIDQKGITAEIIKKHYLGGTEKPKMLLKEFRKHNQKCRELMGSDYAKGTILRFERTVTYLEEYLKKEYALTDMPFKDLDHTFLTGFEHYIKVQKKCAQNTTVKYMTNLKK